MYVIFAFFSFHIVVAYALSDGIQIIGDNSGSLQQEVLNSHQFVTAGDTRSQGLTASQDCDGIRLQWNRLNTPFSPNKPTVNKEFKHFNIYRSTTYFENVSRLKPYVSGESDTSLQDQRRNSYKDMYPPVNVGLYYAVTIVNGEGQEEKLVEAKKVIFVGAVKYLQPLFRIVPDFLSRLGKVLHHSTTWNPKRNEYLVAFDFDVDNDNLPDQLFAVRVNTSGSMMDNKLLNFTTDVNKKAGNQGWPNVAYNDMIDEYMIVFQFRGGARQYNNKYIIISQRVMSSKTEKAAGPSLLMKAHGIEGSTQWVDARNPVIKFNSVTGGYVAAVVIGDTRKKVVGLFVDPRGNVLRSDDICSFTVSAYEPNIFIDSKRKEFYFTCTVQSGGVANADFSLQLGVHMVVLTKRNGIGEHSSNTATADTKKLVGYTNNTFAKTSGYYNKLSDRLTLFWEDSDNGKPFITTASVLITSRRYVREVKPYSCLTTRRTRTPSAVYLPTNGNHFLLWQEQGRGSWVIGGELLQGNLQLAFGSTQKNPVTLYNTRLEGVFVTWQEAGVLFSRHIAIATRPTCDHPCTSRQTCAMQDTCVSSTEDSCTMKNGGCSHMCAPLHHWKVQCSCPVQMRLMEDGKTCQSAPLPSYSMLVATTTSIWQIFMDTKQNRATFQKLRINNPVTLVALDYNPVDKRVYWSDASAKTIKRMSVSGSGGEETLVWNNIGVVDGLTLDVEGDLLYWTDATYQRIEQANLDGQNRRTVLQGLDKPRAILLYKAKRLLYWTDWGAIPKIERANLDGGNRKIIIQGALKWPNGLVIDEASQRLYWADAELDKIETSDLLGQGRHVLLSIAREHHPYSLAILDDRLFWSDWEAAGIKSVDKETGKNVVTVAQGLERPTGFAVFKAAPQAVSSVRCPDTGGPKHGERNPSPKEGDDYPQGAVIRYTCYPQFDLRGPVTRTCMSDGKWSERVPECLTLPRFSMVPTNKTVKETEHALLTCFTSSSDTNITWYKDGKALTGDKFAFLRSGLLILRAGRPDKGWYSCNATNKAGSKVARAYLNVREPPGSGCGRPTLTNRGRIVGGTKVEAGAYPWQVSLWNTREDRHICGGSLVSKRWIVTAANCVIFDISVADLEVRLGKLYTNRVERGREQIIRPDRIVIHPQFNRKRFDYDSDVALIHLSTDAVYTDYVRPICLPLQKHNADKNLLRPGAIGVITGWGAKSEVGRRSLRRMHQVTVPIVDQTLCKAAHRKYVVTSNMFCAGHHNGTLGDACTGDSGGPLAIDNSLTASDDDQRWVLAGIISWGDGCGRIGKYGVYTRVSVFARWIKDQINTED